VLDGGAPPFLYAFAVGRFAEAELEVADGKLRALGPPGSDLTAVLSLTATMLNELVERLGAPLPAEQYVQVLVHGDAAQEAAGMSLLGEGTLAALRADPSDDWIFAHELAHQWFAWSIPCADFADFWLNEGFATFMAAVVKEQRWGRAAYERELATWRTRSAEVHAAGRDAPVSLSGPRVSARAAPLEAELQARGVTYFRGALALHRLRVELGEAQFWAGVRRYVRDQTTRGARSEDLRRAFEAVSGRDLTAWFERWIYTSAPDV